MWKALSIAAIWLVIGGGVALSALAGGDAGEVGVVMLSFMGTICATIATVVIVIR